MNEDVEAMLKASLVRRMRKHLFPGYVEPEKYDFQDDDEREYWDERAGIVAEGMNWEREKAEKVAYAMVLDRRLRAEREPVGG